MMGVTEESDCVSIERGRDKVVHRLSCHHSRSIYKMYPPPAEFGRAEELLEDVMAYACRVCKPDQEVVR